MKPSSSQSGNILFYILIGIVLIGLVTVALRDSGGLNGSVDNEKNAALAQRIIKYSASVAAGVKIILDSGASETDIRFAHPNNDASYGTITTTPAYQVFSLQGGKTSFQTLPADAILSGQTGYITFGGDRNFTQVGSARAELYMSAYPLTDDVCQAINSQAGFTNSVPTIACPTDANATFTGTYSSSASNIDMSGFSKLPATQACVKCSNLSNWNVFFGVLYPR